MGIAFETPFIFNGTVADNILYGVRRTLPENVMEVTAAFGFDKFINMLPNGYETKLTENTVLLTNPEQQAINIARTVLQSPDIIIMNEALNEFDLHAERRINEALINKYKHRTRIFVTKRLQTVLSVDQIFFCRNGEIIKVVKNTE
jgi:ABC-type multidrug transport system fused ATPase/permease subunit